MRVIGTTEKSIIQKQGDSKMQKNRVSGMWVIEDKNGEILEAYTLGDISLEHGGTMPSSTVYESRTAARNSMSRLKRSVEDWAGYGFKAVQYKRA